MFPSFLESFMYYFNIFSLLYMFWSLSPSDFGMIFCSPMPYILWTTLLKSALVVAFTYLILVLRLSAVELKRSWRIRQTAQPQRQLNLRSRLPISDLNSIRLGQHSFQPLTVRKTLSKQTSLPLFDNNSWPLKKQIHATDSLK